ncbi:cyclic pyranopterin monophosphate synthase 1 [mine drainage metagenome]|uniref:GTP 3',8-cyclase n=1 Tax=mine drainage metagenome TaxID=410659 RepID=A0A1J5RCW9_9ZZZZ
MILDKYNRAHNYLRISLTDNCNLRCFYCMPEENYSFMPNSHLMQAEEINQLAKTFVQLGTTKIRLTGGEPLVRKDAADIIKKLSLLPIKLSLTTNGVRIHEFIDVFREANITSINVSLDTLQEDKFFLITKRNNFKRIRDNIQLLLQNNIHVKINVVVMKGINDAEINNFIKWTKQTPIHVRFIEFMPFSGNKWMSNKVFTWQNILAVIESQFDFIKLKDEAHDTTKKYIVPGHVGTFAIISTMTAPFCSTCNRMRLTADGKMKNCLFSKDETDLLTALRNGEDIVPLILQNIHGKAAERGGQFVNNFTELQSAEIHNRSMIAIGG